MVVRIASDVANVEALERDLRRLRRKDVAVNLNRVTKAVMTPLVDEAKRLAPVSQPRRGYTPGRLRDSIRGRRLKGRLVMQVGGPKAHHARFVLGGRRKGSSVVPPNLFLRDLISRRHRQIVDRYRTATRQLFAEIDRQYGRRR